MDIIPLDMCTDCAEVIANDEGTVSHIDLMRAFMFRVGLLGTLKVHEFRTDFSSKACDTCGTTLAGERWDGSCFVPTDEQL